MTDERQERSGTDGWWYGLNPLVSGLITAAVLFLFLLAFDLFVLDDALSEVWMSAGTAAVVIGLFQGLRAAGRARRRELWEKRKNGG